MADDLVGLGSALLYEHTINWREAPKYDYQGDPQRQVLGFEGTVKALFNLSEDKPQILEFTTTLCTMADRKLLLDHYRSVKGQWGRWWLLSPLALFEFATPGQVALGSTRFTVNRTDFDFRGFERVYLLLANGDIITRPIDAYTLDELAGTADIDFVTPTDRIIETSEVLLFSLALLVRYDIDVLKVDYNTDHVGEVSIRCLELVKEYGIA